MLSLLGPPSTKCFYGVRLHGTGILCPSSVSPISGFYTTQMSFARSESEAIASAKSAVMNRWRTDPMYVSWNEGDLPRLEVDQTFQPGFWRAAFFMSTGHAFYAEHLSEEGSDS